MSLIDTLMVGAMVLAAAGRMVPQPRARRLSRVAVFASVGLAILQLPLEGFYWQFIPGYLLIGVIALLMVSESRGTKPGRFTALTIRLGLAGLVLATLAAWSFLPVPKLTRPNGPYRVGTEVFRWVDASRGEPSTADAADRRNVVVQAWYPAAPGVRGKGADYIDGIEHLPDFVTLIPGFVLRRFDRIDTHAVLRAPVSGQRSRWPVVLFSPGYGGPRAFYTSLAADLASRGFVVLAIDHPYEAAVTELADGRIATTVEVFSADDPDRTGFMLGRLQLRAADLSFVIDQLSRPGVLGSGLLGRLDLDHIAAAGHSLGGATAAVAMDADPRIKAAANIDGTLYGDIATRRLQHPFLLLESDHDESGHGERYLTGNARLLGNLEAGGYRYEIAHANHYSFTDAPLFLSWPARFTLARFIGGARGPTETHRATTDILAAFLQGPLTGKPASVEAASSRYRLIIGGAVN